jgi:hypothetical protein
LANVRILDRREVRLGDPVDLVNDALGVPGGAGLGRLTRVRRFFVEERRGLRQRNAGVGRLRVAVALLELVDGAVNRIAGLLEAARDRLPRLATIARIGRRDRAELRLITVGH